MDAQVLLSASHIEQNLIKSAAANTQKDIIRSNVDSSNYWDETSNETHEENIVRAPCNKEASTSYWEFPANLAAQKQLLESQPEATRDTFSCSHIQANLIRE